MKKFAILFVLVGVVSLYGQELSKTSTPETIGLVTNMSINNIDLPMRNDGKYAENARAYYPNGQTSKSFLFSGGHAISANVNNDLRASWMASASLIEEWQCGKWNTDPNDPLAKFYEVEIADGFGSAAYIDWADAVALGADFQDLNNDGLYDPNIDKPDILKDKTLWFQINDSTSMVQRTPRLQTLPIGIEIHISVWAEARYDELGDVIYFRYRLINKTDSLKNDVIFSVWADSDIGEPTDDLVGSDTSFSLGYVYNYLDDDLYGYNPPAFGIQLLQGPTVPSIGDTAYNFRGTYFGIDTLYDQRNLKLQSVMWYRNSFSNLSHPTTAQTARYYQIGGLDENGIPLDPTNWGTGGNNSSNPLFVFSGDPISGTGWIDNAPDDNLILINIEPFDLDIGEQQDIIFAYIVAQGNNSLESVTLLKNRARLLAGLYPLTGVQKSSDFVPAKIHLYQNYPNPFNSATTIEFSIPNSEYVQLKIFDIKGREIQTLVSDQMNAGTYQYDWQAGVDLASGIYYYTINAGDFNSTKKLVLLK